MKRPATRKLCTVLGTRPELVKLAPVIPLLDAEPDIAQLLLHTGQHYSFEMDAVFFRELGLRTPDVALQVGSQSHAAQTAAILVDAKSDYSVGLAEAFRVAFQELGGRVVHELKYTEGDSDFSAQLTAIRPDKPDVLFVPGYYTDAGLIARQARSLGLTSVLLGADGWDSPKLVEIGGEAIEGAYLSNHYSVDDPSPRVRDTISTTSRSPAHCMRSGARTSRPCRP